jgi:hypothetical protein
MDLPLSNTDIRIATACRVCSGNGGFGMRRADTGSGGRPAASANFQDCTTCNGTGWTLKRPGELTPEELRKLLTKLPSLP